MRNKISIQQTNNKENEQLFIDSKFNIINQNKNRNVSLNQSNRNKIKMQNRCFGLVGGAIMTVISLSIFLIFLVGTINFTNERNEHKDDNFYMPSMGPMVQMIVGAMLFLVVLITSIIRILTNPYYKSLKELYSYNKNKEYSLINSKPYQIELEDYINSIKSAPVELLVKIECYHYSKSNNHHHKRKEHMRTKVVTNTESIKLPILSLTDLSNPLVHSNLKHISNQSNFLSVDFIKEYIPEDDQSQHVINSVVNYLISKHSKSDDYYGIDIEFNYVNVSFKDTILYPTCTSPLSFLYNPTIYSLSFLFFGYFPIELFWWYNTSKSSFNFKSLIKIGEIVDIVYVPVVIPLINQNNNNIMYQQQPEQPQQQYYQHQSQLNYNQHQQQPEQQQYYQQQQHQIDYNQEKFEIKQDNQLVNLDKEQDKDISIDIEKY